MDDFRETAARVKGMQVIEDKVRTTLRHHGLKLRAQDLAWNRGRPYEAAPDTLQLSVQITADAVTLQEFTRAEVERCARGVTDPDTTIKIQAIAEQIQEKKAPRKKD